MLQKRSKSERRQRGYSIVELLIAMGVITVFSAFAIPSMIRSYRNFQMDDTASQVAAELKFTRYEAIRRNNVTNCLNKVQNNILTMFTQDPKAPTNNVTINEKQIVFSGTATLADSASVPSAGALAGVVNAGALTTITPLNGTLTFDGRGAKTTAGVSVYWVGNAAYGWRAVTVMPSGTVQVWSYATGTWQQLS